jgi:hypothetical protein
VALTCRALAVLMLAMPATASAQGNPFPDSSRYAFSANFGRFDYDLTRVGKAFMFAARVERPISKYAIAEGGVLYTVPQNSSGNTSHLFIPELQVQVQMPFKVVAPYVGIGGGVTWDSGHQANNQATPQTQGHATDPTVSLSTGARLWFTPLVAGRAEMRRRGIGGDFRGSSTEWTIGLTFRQP